MLHVLPPLSHLSHPPPLLKVNEALVAQEHTLVAARHAALLALRAELQGKTHPTTATANNNLLLTTTRLIILI